MENTNQYIAIERHEKSITLLQAAGCKKLSFDGVNGHLILIAALNRK